jgi:hypothetical protein
MSDRFSGSDSDSDSVSVFRIAVFLFLISGFGFLISGCQSPASRRMDLLKDRVVKLKPLSQFKSMSCQLSSWPTEPALARYRSMFPKETTAVSSEYTWRAREASCEVTGRNKTGMSESERGFVESAVCLLLQVYWVNSPFDELPFEAERLDEKDGRVHLSTGPDQALGLYLDKQKFVVETHTKSRGVLSAEYSETDGEWLPLRLAQRTASGTQIIADQFEWDQTRIGGRRLLKSFWISAGEQSPIQHSVVRFSDCHPL